MKTIVLPLFYLPPVEYFANLLNYPNILLEKHEHFVKQTFRNRCNILSPNGVLPLSIPIKHQNKEHIKVKDIRIHYEDSQWQKIHWRSLESAYRSSPYFEFYEDQLAPFYEREFEFLFDFNLELLDLILKIINIDINYSFTKSYDEHDQEDMIDLRSSMHPKSITSPSTNCYAPEPYTQVFSNRLEFVQNLSIVDLLFNLGPETEDYLSNTKPLT